MKKIDKKVWIFLATAGIFLFVEFLPSIAGLVSDKKYVNKDTLVQKQTDEGIQFDLSLQDKVSILASYEGMATEILSITDVNELADYDTNLLSGLQKQIFKLQNTNMIPYIKCTLPELKEGFVKADYYSISNQYSSVIGVPIWVLEFNGDTDCIYRFAVDASSKKIYGYSIVVPQEDVQLFWDKCMLEPRMRETTDEYIYIENMLNKMAAYFEADNGYTSSMTGLNFDCVLNYDGEFEDASITYEYTITDFDTGMSQSHTEISMGIYNLMKILPIKN